MVSLIWEREGGVEGGGRASGVTGERQRANTSERSAIVEEEEEEEEEEEGFFIVTLNVITVFVVKVLAREMEDQVFEWNTTDLRLSEREGRRG